MNEYSYLGINEVKNSGTKTKQSPKADSDPKSDHMNVLTGALSKGF